MRGGERDLHRRPPGDRQPARQPGHQARHQRTHPHPLMAFRRNKKSEPRLRKDRTGMSPVKAGVLLSVFVLVVTYFGLLEGHPVHPGLPGQGRLPVGQLDPQELAGPHRRRQRRQGQVDQGLLQGRCGDDSRRRRDGDPEGGPADPQGRLGPHPAAHLPRGQLLRRSVSRHAVLADRRLWLHDPDQPREQPDSARRGADRAAERHAREPPGRARPAWQDAQRQARCSR